MKNSLPKMAGVSVASLLCWGAQAASCVLYPSVSPTALELDGRAAELRFAAEFDPCAGRVVKGKMVLVARGANGNTLTREFAEGAAFDATAVGVARPGKLLTAILMGDFVPRGGYSRGPLEHPEAYGLPVGDLLQPTVELRIAAAPDLLSSGYDQLSFGRRGASTTPLTLALSGREVPVIAASFFVPDAHYSWRLQGKAGVQEGVFHVLGAQQQQDVMAELNAVGSDAIPGRIRKMGLLIDRDLRFDALTLQRSLAGKP
jgi:hypothetical protein